MEIEAPRADRRQSQARTGTTDSGFGTATQSHQANQVQTIRLLRGKWFPQEGGLRIWRTCPSAVSVVQNRGIESLGYTGVPNMIQGQPGVYTSGYSATPFDSAVVLRGFSSDPGNRVSLLYDGRSLNTASGGRQLDVHIS